MQTGRVSVPKRQRSSFPTLQQAQPIMNSLSHRLPTRLWGALALFTLLVVGLLSQGVAQAETWTDITGQYEIEAEYAGVKGRSVVLRLANGETKEVPIDKLSAKSRARAKQLYDAAKLNAATPAPTTPAPAKPTFGVTPSAAPAAATLSVSGEQPDFAPAVPPVGDLPAFPENASLQETVDFIQAQVLAGHPEVFWYALPDDLRAELDSAEVREAMAPAIKMQTESQKPMRGIAMKVCEILIRKKQFILNSQTMTMAPPPVKPIVESVYDPASGLIYELVSMMFGAEAMMDQSIAAFVNHHGPRIGGHLQQLIQKAPPGMIEQFTAKIVVNQIDNQSGTITVPDNSGGTTTIEMAAYRGRWMPKEFVEKWAEKSGTMAAEMKKEFAANQAQMQAQQQQMAMAVGMIAGTADQILNPMLNANTQQEFDAAIMQAMGMAAMFQGNGGPPGFAPAPGARNPAF